MKHLLKLISISLLCGAFFISVQGQNRSKIDSLTNVLKTVKEDTNKVNTLNDLSKQYWQMGNYLDAKKYADDALQFSMKIRFKKGEANAYNLKGLIYYQQGNYSEALKNHFAAMKIRNDIGDKKGMAGSNNNIGIIYANQGNYSEALKSYFTALQLNEEIGNKKDIATCYNNIGIIYWEEKNYEDALKNYIASLKVREEIGDKKGIADCYDNIGSIYFRQQNIPDALKNCFASLKIREEIGDKNSIAISHNNIGEIYLKQGNYPYALKNYLAALKIRIEIGDKEGLAISYNTLGYVNVKLKNFSEARKYLNDGLYLSKETGSKNTILNCYVDLSELDSTLGNYKQSLEYYKLYITYKDSLHNESSSMQIAEMQNKYETEKKEKEIVSLTKDNAIQELEIKKQTLLKNSFIGGLALMLILSFFVYNNFRTANKLKLQNIRNKIASDLHDDVGSTLNSISVYSEVAKQKSPAVVDELEHIGDASRKIIEVMSDIVWTINPKNDTFENIILRMSTLTYNLLKAKNIDHTFQADEILNETKLSLESRRNFYLIFKEALNNLVKYSNATRASITLTSENGLIKLSVRDNGVGFDVAQTSKGNGLLNMKSRAEEMNAQLKIESEKGSGTNVELILKS